MGIADFEDRGTKYLPHILLLIAIWLSAHRYVGIQHDAIFYTVQALALLEPSNFQGDLFFLYGSQSDLTIYPKIQAVAIQAFGIGLASLLLVALTHILWAVSAAFLVKQVLTGTPFWVCLAIIFGIPGNYGPLDVFHYAESFPTARTPAESLILAGLALSLNGKRAYSLICVFLSALIHPIIALPGVIFVAISHIRPSYRHQLGVALAFAIGTTLLPQMEHEWRSVVTVHAPFLFLENWKTEELIEPITWICILASAYRIPSHVSRRLFGSMLVVAFLAILLTLLGYWSGAALLIQAQPWRSVWLIKVTSLIALTSISVTYWERSATDKWLVIGFICVAISATTYGGLASIPLTAIAHRAWRNTSPPPTLPGWVPIAGGVAIFLSGSLTVVASLMEFGNYAFGHWSAQTHLHSTRPAGSIANLLDGPTAWILPLIMLLAVQIFHARAWLSNFVIGVIVIYSLSNWRLDRDIRTKYLFEENHTTDFHSLIPESAVVYWHGDFQNSWFLLHRSNYASKQQSVGVVFSRMTAMESRRRLGNIDTFSRQFDLADSQSPASQSSQRQRALQLLCADPVLDFVVVPGAFGITPMARWIAPFNAVDYGLYGCSETRKNIF
ncbi:MAG: hypothetical protein EG825_06220 [Rhodocyclaceae bacterium]|nr:hypothetical protein [Rhodocyclaceae bacterium]